MVRLMSTMFKRRGNGAQREPGRIRRFMRDVRGVAAIEFGFIAPPFFFLLFSMFEIGLTYTADAVLQNAVNDTARMIRTGQVDSQDITDVQFRAEVCNRINVLLDCDGDRLQIDVRKFDGFGGAGFSSPLDADGKFRDDYKYEPGGPCDVILVRAFYKWNAVMPGLDRLMSNMKDGRLLMGTAAIRNEPYIVGGSSC